VKLASPDAVRIVTMPPPASPNRLFIPSMFLSSWTTHSPHAQAIRLRRRNLASPRCSRPFRNSGDSGS
jgi:hypothetical protein